MQAHTNSLIALLAGINHTNFALLSIPVLSVVILHNLLGLSAGYLIPKAFRYNAKTCRTVSIEIGMQNSGLSVALAIQYFSTAEALPGALFGIWHNMSGSVLAAYWNWNTRKISNKATGSAKANNL